MPLPSDLTFDAHIAPILAGDHAPGLPREVEEIQALLARIAFPRRPGRRAASIVASMQARVSSRLEGKLQRWKDLGDEERLLYIVMGLMQTNIRFNAFATLHLKENENESAEQLVEELRQILRQVDPTAEVLAVESCHRRIRHVHALIAIPKAPTTRAGRAQLRQIVTWFDQRNGRPGVAWKSGSGVSAHLEWLDEQKAFQRVGVGGLLGAACYMAAQQQPRLVAGRILRAIGKQLHADATNAVRQARGHAGPYEEGVDVAAPSSSISAERQTVEPAPAFDVAELARQEWARSWWRVPPLVTPSGTLTYPHTYAPLVEASTRRGAASELISLHS